MMGALIDDHILDLTVDEAGSLWIYILRGRILNWLDAILLILQLLVVIIVQYLQLLGLIIFE